LLSFKNQVLHWWHNETDPVVCSVLPDVGAQGKFSTNIT